MEELQAKLKALQDADKQKVQDELQLQLQTALLRSAVQQQQLSLVNAQSAVSAYVVRYCSLIITACHEADGMPFQTTRPLRNRYHTRPHFTLVEMLTSEEKL